MKQCGRCKQDLPLDAFNKNARQKDGLHRDCRACKKKYQADWYQRHKAEHRKRTRLLNRQHRATSRALVIAAKARPCADCAIEYPWYVMDFDHLPGMGKLHNISDIVKRGMTVATLEAEIKKCEVVCANCHRIRTFTRGSLV